MLGFVTVGLAAVALMAYLATQRRDPMVPGAPACRCPTCRAPMTALTAGPSTEPGHVRSYDVLACPTCTNAVTMVHGTRSQFAYCPACQQRTLETPCIRLSSDRGDPIGVEVRVEVRENCHLCGYEATVLVERDEPAIPERRGQVIRFPGARKP